MDAETQEIRQARQRASVKWLLSKSFNNRVPDNLKEPFYRDHENHERLKPQIIVELGNASLYCQALSNLYSDPNYQSLNHWSILQTLTRKGVPVAETADMPLTETVLIQTNPLKINAHMAVIESLMLLYAKELCSGERIQNAIRRISGGNYVTPAGQTVEQSLLTWISYACASLKKRIDRELESNSTDENGQRLQSPDIPPVRDFQDLCDGICLALLISYYCPKVLPWTKVRINYLPAVEDSIHNILLVSNFSQKHLPYSVFHMTPEDVTYMRGSMKLNLMVLLTDLFNLFEIHPAKCVCYPDMEPIVANSPSTSRIYALSLNNENQSNDENISVAAQNEVFVVHKSRGITTLSSMHNHQPQQQQQQQQQQEPLVPARLRHTKEKTNSDSKADERGDIAAGRPSNWEQNRRPSYAGRRSRRNSSSEDSQLTIENFGGSQDQLNTIGRFDRERERKPTNTIAVTEQAVAVRSSLSDARGTIQLGYDTDSGSEKQDRETEKYPVRRQPSVDNVALTQPNVLQVGQIITNSSPVLQSRRAPSMEREYYNDNMSETNASAFEYETTPVRKLSQTNMSWQNSNNDAYEDEMRSLENASKLSNIRMKLEEKKRRIEEDKRRIELALLRHQEKQSPEEPDTELIKWETQSTDSKRATETDQGDIEKYQQAAYGSQQHITDHYQHRQLPQNFGSTPHIPQAFNQSIAFNSRPPSRDPYQQMSSVQMQYINDRGQYVSPHQQPSLMQQNQYMRSGNVYIENNMPFQNQPYNSTQFGNPNIQMHTAPYMKRAPEYDEYTASQGLNYRDPNSPLANNFYINDSPNSNPQRKTWSNTGYDPHQQSMVDVNAWQSQQKAAMVPIESGSLNWNKQQSQQQQQSIIPNKSNTQGFVLHQNGGVGGGELQHLFQVHSSAQHTPTAGIQRQQSLNNIRDRNPPQMLSKPSIAMGMQGSNPDELMAPQSICFIGDEEDVDEIERNIIESMQSTRITEYVHQQQEIYGIHNNSNSNNNDGLSQKVNVTSGNLTYRIPSPSRPSLHANSFQNPREELSNEKGFYISFDDDQPKRPKPPLRAKRSPKKEKSFDQTDDHNQKIIKRESLSQLHNSNHSIGESCNGVDATEIRKRIENFHRVENNTPSNNATYNKYNDSSIQYHQNVLLDQKNTNSSSDRRHLEDLTNQQQANDRSNSPLSPKHFSPTSARQLSNRLDEAKSKAIVIGTDVGNLDPESVDEMERRKEKIMLMSLQRRQQQEETKARKEIEAAQRREREREKEEERARKKEEQMARRAAILEQHRLKKAIEEAEREGKTVDRFDLSGKSQAQQTIAPRLRQQRTTRPRPKTIHVDDGSVDLSETSSISSRGKKGSSTNLTGYGQLSSHSMRRDYYKGSQDSLAVKEPTVERGRTLTRISVAKGSTLNLRGRKSNSLMNLCDTDSGLGRATPPRRVPSPGMASSKHMPSPSGPGSLPPGLISKRRGFDDGSSDMSSTPNLMMEYSGPKLYKQPAAKSNRGIILNAVEYCVFPGAVNREAKQRVLEKIARSEAKHFLILFRDAGCQFRALYSYVPENDLVIKLYGTGPSQVDEVMFDKFFKYNSGGKCFSQVHTKHLTVTIDAFTIHNSLWQGKKVHLPNKKDMALVI